MVGRGLGVTCLVYEPRLQWSSCNAAMTELVEAEILSDYTRAARIGRGGRANRAAGRAQHGASQQARHAVVISDPMKRYHQEATFFEGVPRPRSVTSRKAMDRGQCGMHFQKIRGAQICHWSRDNDQPVPRPLRCGLLESVREISGDGGGSIHTDRCGMISSLPWETRAPKKQAAIMRRDRHSTLAHQTVPLPRSSLPSPPPTSRIRTHPEPHTHPGLLWITKDMALHTGCTARGFTNFYGMSRSGPSSPNLPQFVGGFGSSQ